MAKGKQGKGVSRFGKLARAAVLSAGVCVGLDSCWFNSSGFIFDAASSTSKATTADISAGTKVYEKRGVYYVELPTYDTGKGPKLIYGIGAQDNRKERTGKNGRACFRISAPYAMYLTGQSDVPAKPELIYDDISPDSSYRQLPVVRSVDSNAECKFTDSCFGSSFLQLIGLVDFVAVDIPMSVVCTTVMTAGSVFTGTYSLVKWAASSSSAAAGAASTAGAAARTADATAATAATTTAKAASTLTPASETSVMEPPAVENPATQTAPQDASDPEMRKKSGRDMEDDLSVCTKCKGSGRVQDDKRPWVIVNGVVQKNYKVCPDCRGKIWKFHGI